MNPDDFEKWATPVPVRPVPMDARRALVLEAAIRWWEAHRPEGWTEDMHLQYPEAGSTGREAFLLSDAVASLVSHIRDVPQVLTEAGLSHDRR